MKFTTSHEWEFMNEDFPLTKACKEEIVTAFGELLQKTIGNTKEVKIIATSIDGQEYIIVRKGSSIQRIKLSATNISSMLLDIFGQFDPKKFLFD